MPADQIPIGTFSRITHLSQKALRLYDERGLLVPAARDICTGYRYYTFVQVERGIRIRHLLWLGFGLSEVESILEARERGDAGTIREHFARRLAETEREAGRLHAIAEALRKQKQDPFNGGFSMAITEPVIKDIPATRALSRRERGVYQEAIPRMIGELCAYVSPADGRQPAAKVTGPIMFICHDEEYRETDADIEVALPIVGSVNLDGSAAGVVTLPGGRFVSVLHTGPYPGVGKAYERLFAYMNEHRLVPAGPSRELYLNDPAEVPEEELLTEVQFPVQDLPPSP
ncbi:DNA-binding transcriptional regulator CueR [Methanoculleus chikugoensis]|jgi:effector-binding domain-containing protein|uniref:DNA-binding transcriptional regulator CueR n=1 Tax=Methanoculleus chikugoensis TaxID=118126 RepID=A0A1M4MKM7_9EURY|nr:MerR family transcriptional regulator [Methanoculleus chikugoensis]MDD4567639.1 MerR family transcriptional regulator [Methanoculleus chikugoensis]NMA10453.1 MerR family transcriptional regulator [Methanomicrobiales archaeon]SCL75459.1 DNA-binding transcriptional regulator CueR [Methanoculleus chikugoensis]